MTVARLRVEMDSPEFTRWVAFDEFERRLAKRAPTADTTRDDEDDD